VIAQIGQQKCMASSQSAILKFPAASMSLKGLGVGKVIYCAFFAYLVPFLDAGSSGRHALQY
jgi:hypothetical protein